MTFHEHFESSEDAEEGPTALLETTTATTERGATHWDEEEMKHMDDVRILGYDPIIQPLELASQFPISKSMEKSIRLFRHTTRRILEDHDDRLLVVVGPCSIHDPQAALEYAALLQQAAATFANDLFLIMRCYLEKPRTTIGWKGLINDPYLDGTFRINEGLLLARKLFHQLAEMQVPIAMELLDTISPQYLAELVTWGSVGARTTESQLHRELASGVSFPVGIKNGTDGRVQIAVDAIQTAMHPHHFLGVSKVGRVALTHTKGNPTCHLILRGGRTPNYTSEHVVEATRQLTQAQLPGALLIDCSHGNASKDHRNQQTVAHDVALQLQQGQTAIKGVMLESFLVEGKQPWGRSNLVYGQSITDACLSWEQTLPILHRLAEAVQARRKR